MTRSDKRILVVDDEGDVAFTLKVILEKYGFVVDCFTDSTTALQSFKTDFYDLLILDIKMPSPNGFELYSQLKSKDANIKTLFLKALNSVESYNAGENKVHPLKGKRHFFKKPITSNELLEQVFSLTN